LQRTVDLPQRTVLLPPEWPPIMGYSNGSETEHHDMTNSNIILSRFLRPFLYQCKPVSITWYEVGFSKL
jgi:hypothetical protein